MGAGAGAGGVTITVGAGAPGSSGAGCADASAGISSAPSRARRVMAILCECVCEPVSARGSPDGAPRLRDGFADANRARASRCPGEARRAKRVGEGPAARQTTLMLRVLLGALGPGEPDRRARLRGRIDPHAAAVALDLLAHDLSLIHISEP